VWSDTRIRSFDSQLTAWKNSRLQWGAYGEALVPKTVKGQETMGKRSGVMFGVFSGVSGLPKSDPTRAATLLKAADTMRDFLKGLIAYHGDHDNVTCGGLGATE
jgi:hypothetical protein